MLFIKLVISQSKKYTNAHTSSDSIKSGSYLKIQLIRWKSSFFPKLLIKNLFTEE